MYAAAGLSESGSAGRRWGMWVSATARPPPPPTCEPGMGRGIANRQMLLPFTSHAVRPTALQRLHNKSRRFRSKPHRVQLAQQALRVG